MTETMTPKELLEWADSEAGELDHNPRVVAALRSYAELSACAERLLTLARRALERNNADLALEESKLTAYDAIEAAFLTSECEEPHPEEVTERVLLMLREFRALKQPVPTGEVTPVGVANPDDYATALDIVKRCTPDVGCDEPDEDPEELIAHALAGARALGYQRGRESAQGGWVAVESLPELIAAGERIRDQLSDVCPGCTTYIEDWDTAVVDARSQVWIKPTENPPEDGAWAWIVWSGVVQEEPWLWVPSDDDDDGGTGSWMSDGAEITDSVDYYMPLRLPPPPSDPSKGGR